MLLSSRIAVLAVLLVTVGATASGCGSSHHTDASVQAGDLPPNAVARVGNKVITTDELARWTRAVSGDSFFHFTHKREPADLVTYPAHQTRCAATWAFLAARFSEGSAKVTPEEASTKCRNLTADIQHEALSRLIGFAVLRGLSAEAGVQVSLAEVQQQIKRMKRSQGQAAFVASLADKRWSLAELRAEVEQELLSAKLNVALRAKYSFPELEKYAHEGAKKWAAQTTCKQGLVIEECAGYTGGNKISQPTSTAAILESLASLEKAPSSGNPNCVLGPHGVICVKR